MKSARHFVSRVSILYFKFEGSETFSFFEVRHFEYWANIICHTILRSVTHRHTCVVYRCVTESVNVFWILRGSRDNDFTFCWQVSDVKLWESSPDDEKKFKPSPNQESFKRALEENILFFTENNGRFEVVSPQKLEPVYVTNIKRGMLSALQLQFTEENQTVIPEVRNFTSYRDSSVFWPKLLTYLTKYSELL